MKNVVENVCTMLLAILAVASCTNVESGDATIRIGLSEEYSFQMLSGIERDAKRCGVLLELPDTNDFILEIKSERGNIIYSGSYGERPEVIKVPSGVYELSLLSVRFSEPKFNEPQFGDSQHVTLSSGDELSVKFGCRQLNSGVRLVFADSFRNRFYGSRVKVIERSNTLLYPFTEKRFAYFLPGQIRVVCDDDGEITPVFSRTLQAADMLTVKLSASASGGAGFGIELDTMRNWIDEDLFFGGDGDGSSPEKALSVAELGSYIGAEGLWVKGYIVGGDLTSSNVNLDLPIAKSSHIAISDTPTPSSRAECAGMELPAGKIREALNLIEHPELIGTLLYVKGDIVLYFGTPGVKSPEEYRLE